MISPISKSAQARVRVSVMVDMGSDELILLIDTSTGLHEVVLHSYGLCGEGRHAVPASRARSRSRRS
jgi:hypothetical protein